MAVISLVISLCYILRRPNAAQWPKYMALWPLVAIAQSNLGHSVSMVQIKDQYFNFSIGLATQLMLLCWAALYLIKSRYLSVYFAEWPELDAKKRRHSCTSVC